MVNKRKKTLDIILITAALVILALMLTACGFFGSRTKITEVDVSASVGLEEDASAGVYFAEIGQAIVLDMSWNKGATNSPEIKWFLGEEGKPPGAIEKENSKRLVYTFFKVDGKIYELYGEANGVKSPVIKIKTQYATLHDIVLKSDTDKIINNTVQRANHDLDRINLSAEWDVRYFEQGSVCAVTWSDGAQAVKAESGVSSTQYSLIPTENMKKIITVEVSRSINGTVKESRKAAVTLETVERFDPVDGIETSVKSGAVSHADYDYYVCDYADVGNLSVTLGAYSKPETSRLGADVTWTVRNADGIKDLTSTEHETTFTPAYGKNVVTATIENFVSKPITIYALTAEQYSRRRAVIENTFIWNGVTQSHYIADQTDLNSLIAYMISLHKVSEDGITNAHVVYLQPDAWKGNTTAAKEAMEAALVKAISGSDESGSFAISYQDDRISLSPTHDKGVTFFGEPQYKYTNYNVTQLKSVTHYALTPSDAALPAESFKRSMNVGNSNQLYRALSWGYRPVFAQDNEGVKLKALYDKAAGVLKRVVSPNMTELEKVRAVYQWICNEVDYDYASLDDTRELSIRVNYNAYYLEGVFNDAQAVCDGKSKAFAMMCGMLGIKAVRVTGLAQSDTSQDIRTFDAAKLKTLTGHAWNKVFIDPDGDGIRDWYVVDTTWGDVPFDKNDSRANEFCAMNYFLVQDSDIQKTHLPESPVNPPAVKEYDYYSSNDIAAGAAPLEIKSAADLKNILEYLVVYGKRINTQFISADVKISMSEINDANNLNGYISASGVRGFFSHSSARLDDGNDKIFFIELKLD